MDAPYTRTLPELTTDPVCRSIRQVGEVYVPRQLVQGPTGLEDVLSDRAASYAERSVPSDAEVRRIRPLVPFSLALRILWPPHASASWRPPSPPPHEERRCLLETFDPPLLTRTALQFQQNAHIRNVEFLRSYLSEGGKLPTRRVSRLRFRNHVSTPTALLMEPPADPSMSCFWRS